MGIVKAICISEKRGTQKTEIQQAEFITDWGIENDAHAGDWHRQVSLLSYEKIQEFRKKGADVEFGAFGENLIVEGFDFRSFPIGTRFLCGEVLLEMTQIGKECHSHCEIYKKMGECIMPKEGVFAVVLKGGQIKKGDRMELIPDNLYQTLSDRKMDCNCVLATVVKGPHHGDKCLWMNGVVRWENSSVFFLRDYATEITESPCSCLLELEDDTIFCEKIGNRKQLIICGAGHVSMPMIELGKRMGFLVTVIDDRPLFANNARKAGADEVFCERFEDALKQIEGSKDSYFVIVTRGHRYDIDCLRMIIKKANAYIGMMGSKKRVALVKSQLEEEGNSLDLLERIHTPIGLSIGAETPEEIAVSVMAEIIKEKNAVKRISGYDQELMSYLVGDQAAGQRKILCTIVSRHGSAPREIGTKMLLLEDGTIVGTIGGGCAESSIIQKGLWMLKENQEIFRLESVDMTGRAAEEAGMVCGGTILVYMEHI